MDRSRRGHHAEGVRFVTEPDGTVTAEHVASGESAVGGTATEALTALYEGSELLDADELALDTSGDDGGTTDEETATHDTSSPAGSASEFEWIDPAEIETRDPRRDEG